MSAASTQILSWLFFHTSSEFKLKTTTKSVILLLRY